MVQNNFHTEWRRLNFDVAFEAANEKHKVTLVPAQHMHCKYDGPYIYLWCSYMKYTKSQQRERDNV